MVICREQGADCLHMVQLMPLHPKTLSSLASFKSRLVLLFWYWLTQVVLEKRTLNRCKKLYHGATGIMFSGCLSVRACVCTCGTWVELFSDQLTIAF